jgi:DnaJ like chaperone protein
MGIIGKVIGGTIGFAIGGPLGAIAGAVFGHAFDTNDLMLDTENKNALSYLEESQLAFFVGTFSMLAKLANADGRVTREEIETIEGFATRELGLSDSNRQVALNIFNTALNSPAVFEDFASQFYQHFHQQPQLIETMIDILLRVSVADGRMNASEEQLILTAVRIFNLSQTRYEQLKSRYSSKTDKAFDVLGCRPEDSFEKIKKQYRHLVQQYHPDKIASKGLPDEFIQLAHQKFREIQSAYDEIRKHRGLK